MQFETRWLKLTALLLPLAFAMIIFAIVVLVVTGMFFEE
jgi:uncharacterized membrane protein YhdT